MRNAYVEDDLSEVSQSDHVNKSVPDVCRMKDQPARPADPALSEQVNHTLLRLVQEAKERLEVEKSQASKSNTPMPFRNTPGIAQGSVPRHQAGRVDFQDSPLFASDDDERDSPQAEHTKDDQRSEATSTDEVVYNRGRLDAKRTYVTADNAESPDSGSYKRRRASAFGSPAGSAGSQLAHNGKAATLKREEVPAPTLVQLLKRSKIFKLSQPEVFAYRPGRTGHTVYITTQQTSKPTRWPSPNLQELY
jgi:hypothetical protein